MESAFDVLVRARALEAQGVTSFTWKSRAGFRNAAAHHRSRAARDGRGVHALRRAQGDPQLREEIALYIRATRGIPVGPENVCVTPGAKPILFFVMLAALSPGTK